MNKVVIDGKVAVLYSPGFGGGWSTWSDGNNDMIFDSVIVDAVENSLPFGRIQEYMEATYPNAYCGAYSDLEIRWIEEGTNFKIDEHDGSESIVIEDKDYWIIA